MAQDTPIHHQTRQARADAKIALQKSRMKQGGALTRPAADDVQLMNEMRQNKTAVDLNRALFDYGAEAEKV